MDRKKGFNAGMCILSEAEPPVPTADATDTERFVAEQISGYGADDGRHALFGVKIYGRRKSECTWENPESIDYNMSAVLSPYRVIASKEESAESTHPSG